jgi:hypothetical protein
MAAALWTPLLYASFSFTVEKVVTPWSFPGKVMV